jgi:hypothetical protein
MGQDEFHDYSGLKKVWMYRQDSSRRAAAGLAAAAFDRAVQTITRNAAPCLMRGDDARETCIDDAITDLFKTDAIPVVVGRRILLMPEVKFCPVDAKCVWTANVGNYWPWVREPSRDIVGASVADPRHSISYAEVERNREIYLEDLRARLHKHCKSNTRTL